MTGVAVPEERPGSALRDLVMLTKPRIISLLLVTTVVPMFVARTPTFALVALVTVAGYLMAGGANAVNMYLDRDIDEQMARTRLRPIPSGRMNPRAVLAFGVALATAATVLPMTADPATGEMTERLELEGEVEDGMDAIALGSWPWVGFEDHLFRLPSLDEVDHGLPSTGGPYGLEIVAVIPPPGVP